MTLKRKIAISIIFFLISGILLILFLIYSLLLEIKKISHDFSVQKQTLATLEKKAEDLEKFQKIFLPEILSGLEKIDNLLIDPEVPVDFIRFLEKTSQDSALSLKISLGPALEIKKDPWPSITFQLSLAGSFPNLARFLEKLESSFYLTEVQNLTVSRLTETELKLKEFEHFSLGDVKATLTIKVYTK